MGLEPDTLTFDCADPVRVATFWAAALDWELAGVGVELSAFIADPLGEARGIFFQKVPESKVVKNRMHLDVRPTGSMAVEVERLQGLGASVRGFLEIEGSFWTQMRDPEGNEFCVLRGPEDGWTTDEL